MPLFRPNVEKMENKRNIKGLTKALRYKDLDVRSAAAEALARIGAPAVELLIETMKEKDSSVRVLAVMTLGRLRDARALEPLIQALRDEDREVRLQAVGALVGIGKPGVEPLIQTLKDKDPSVRGEAVLILKEIGDVRAVATLTEALKDEDKDVRLAATLALGKIGDARAVEPLVRALKDACSIVQMGAADALADIGDARAVEALFHFLWSVSLSSPIEKDKEVREKVAQALGKIGEAAVKSLTQALRGEDREARWRAAWTLDKIGWKPRDDTERAHYLVAHAAALGKKEWDELARLGEPAVEALVHALEDEHLSVCSAAAEALGKIGDLRAAEAIIDWLFMSGQPPLLAPEKDLTPELRKEQELNSWIEVMKNLFGDYTALILKASMDIRTSWAASPGRSHEAGEIDHHLGESNKAVHELLSIPTQISNNILHRVSRRADLEVMTRWDNERPEMVFGPGTLSLEAQREAARKELKLRGNPPYDPSAYLNKGAWKL